MMLFKVGRSIAAPAISLLMLTGFASAALAQAAAPVAHDTSLPVDNEEAYINWMAVHRPLETPKMLHLRWERAQFMIKNKDLTRDLETRAFLATPRERFVIPQTMAHVYDSAFLDIGYGVTISGPHLVMHMTTALDVKPSDRVMEIGTGSGYQSAILAALSNHVYTVEIIPPLAARTREHYDKLIADGYKIYENIHTKNADGYYGWEENGPFDKIIVTCGIDHIPPPLLKQLAVGGTMVIPVGPPGNQTVLAVHKILDAQGEVTITREDIYGGRIKVPFVPFTKEGGGTWNH
jgi:protein-L-isoaspartate(D-aspartate) O-methyltransferase